MAMLGLRLMLRISPAQRSKEAKERLEAVAGSLGGQDNVRIRETRDWLELELGSEVLFATGSATLNPGAEGAVDGVERGGLERHGYPRGRFRKRKKGHPPQRSAAQKCERSAAADDPSVLDT